MSKKKTAFKWFVYFLPNANYCGMTSNLHRRLIVHRSKHKRDTSNCLIVAEFFNKKEALKFEKAYQLENNTHGASHPIEWRKNQSNRDLSYLHKMLSKPIRCIETGEVFESIRLCERTLGISKGNISKHLKGHPHHKTVKKLTFEYIINEIYESDGE